MAVDLDLRNGYVGAVGGSGQGAYTFCTALHNVLGDALDENLADEVGLGELGAGGEVRGVEGFGEGQVLLCDDPSRYALQDLL